MTTSQQFGQALKTISNYKLKLENGLVQNAPNDITVDIKKNNIKQVFSIFQLYYSFDVMQKLKWENLNAKDLETLKTTDFNNQWKYRGFGIMALEPLKNTINTFLNSNLSI